MLNKKKISNNNLKYAKVYCSNKLIASKIMLCNTPVKKGTGLMFRSKNSVKNTAWLFPFKNSRKVSVTMFFVFFPIDVIFLDKNNKIIELKENFKPFTNYICVNKIFSFIELECGTIKKNKLNIGDKISFD